MPYGREEMGAGRPIRPVPPGVGYARSAPYDLPRPLAAPLGGEDYSAPTKVE